MKADVSSQSSDKICPLTFPTGRLSIPSNKSISNKTELYNQSKQSHHVISKAIRTEDFSMDRENQGYIATKYLDGGERSRLFMEILVIYCTNNLLNNFVNLFSLFLSQSCLSWRILVGEQHESVDAAFH